MSTESSAPVTHRLECLDRTGHSTTTWAPTDAPATTLAERAFADLRRQGYLIEAVDPADPAKGEMVTTFDPTVEHYIAHRALVGG